jgi:hypothetical protein
MKTLSLRKKGMVQVAEGIEIPVKTLSIGEEASIKFPLPKNLPMKLTALSENDKQVLKDQDPNYNPKAYLATKVLDTQSKEYRDYQKKIEKYAPILDAIKYIDFEAEVTKEGKTMKYYESIELGNYKDWFEACKYFDEAGLGENHVEKIILYVKQLTGHSISQKLWNLQKITEMDYYELISGLEEVLDNKEQVREKALAEIEKLTEDRLAETFHKLKDGEKNA